MSLMVFFSMGKEGAPAVWNMPTENHRFVGRDDIIEEIKMRLNAQQQEVVVIRGPQGFGKTQIAKRFVYKNFQKYDVVWWFKANQYLQPQFEKFAEAMAIYLDIKPTHPEAKEQLARLVKDTVRRKNIRCLIVFDDAQSFADIEKYILYSHQHHVDTIVTTKNSTFAMETISVPPFKREESLHYINQFLTEEPSSSKTKLAAQLGDWPAAIAVAIDHIKGYPGMTITQYLKKHVDFKNAQDESKRPDASLDDYNKDLETTIQLSINEIRETSKEAYHLLGLLAILHRDETPIAWVEGWAKDRGIKQNASDLLSIIMKKSLIDVSPKHPEKGISMQELLQSIVSENIPAHEKKILIDEATHILNKYFQHRTENNLDAIVKENKVIPNAVRVSREANDIGHQSPELTQLRILTLDLLVGWIRDFVNAEDMIGHIDLDVKKGIFIKPEHNVTYHAIMGLYHGISSPDYDKAIFYQSKALKLLEKTTDQYDEHLRILCNLIQHYCLVGLNDTVLDYIKKGEEIFDQCQFHNYRSLFVLARNVYLMDRAEFEKIIDLNKKYEDVCRRQSSFSPMRYFILAQLAEAYYKKRDFLNAQETLAISEKYGREVHGDNEENMLFGRLYVLKGAFLMGAPEDFEKAKALIEKGIRIQNTNFRGDKKHRSQGFAYLQLGHLCRKNGKYEEAKMAYLKSDEIYNAVVKSQNFDDFSTLYEHIIYVGINLKDEALIYKYFRKMLEIFGENHPRVKQVRLTLDRHDLYLAI